MRTSDFLCIRVLSPAIRRTAVACARVASGNKGETLAVVAHTQKPNIERERSAAAAAAGDFIRDGHGTSYIGE